MSFSTSRRGLTLVELLVVVSILGLLAALVVPAVQASREASRRVECANHLKQLGLSLTGHQAEHGVFPSGMPIRSRSVTHPNGSGWFLDVSPLYELLPYLGESALFNAVNLGNGPGSIGGPQVIFEAESRENTTAAYVRVASFLCPSDGLIGETPLGPNSYRYNLGSSQPNFWPIGAFVELQALAPSAFEDGLSTTAGMAERLLGSQSLDRFDPARDFRYTSLSPFVRTKSDEVVRQICLSLDGSPASWSASFGRSWFQSGITNAQYNHILTPNATHADCTLNGRFGDPPVDDPDHSAAYWALSSRSAHPGGVQVVMMDGSVRFIRSSIAYAVWRALGTRSGGEVVDLDL